MRKIMKLFTFLALAVLILLFGCSKKTPLTSDSESEAENTTAKRSTEFTEETTAKPTPSTVTIVQANDIPLIKAPENAGTIVFENKTAYIDASNMNNGFISARYKGSNQKVKVQVICNKIKYNYDLKANGENEIFPLQLGDGHYTIKVLENISGTKYAAALTAEIDIVLKDPNSVFLYPNQYVNFNEDSDAVKKAAELCTGKKSDIDKITAIFEYITTNIKYDTKKATTVKSGYLPDVDEILEAKKGICFDYAAVFASMCRSEEIPAKLVTGYAEPSNIYHSWNEVYTTETGWISVDIFLKNKGYNLVDSTFYANAADKANIAKYIGNGTNYKILYTY